jgi:hypothetical protein
MACDVRLATTIDPAVDRRLRMLALVRRQSLRDVLSEQLDQVLPSAGELAGQLAPSQEAIPA